MEDKNEQSQVKSADCYDCPYINVGIDDIPCDRCDSLTDEIFVSSYIT